MQLKLVLASFMELNRKKYINVVLIDAGNN